MGNSERMGFIPTPLFSTNVARPIAVASVSSMEIQESAIEVDTQVRSKPVTVTSIEYEQV